VRKASALAFGALSLTLGCANNTTSIGSTEGVPAAGDLPFADQYRAFFCAQLNHKPLRKWNPWGHSPTLCGNNLNLNHHTLTAGDLRVGNRHHDLR
jgi:hypothetical protein